MSASPKAAPAKQVLALDSIPSVEAPNPYKWIIVVAVMLGTILEVLDTSIINVALPHMQGTFSASVDEITWVVTSYLVANGIMIPMTGWISARFGRKRYFLLSVTGFVLASAACGAARSLNQIVLFRLLQGLAGAAMQPSSQAILMETFPPEEQALAMAWWGIGMTLAPIIGPTVGGWITDNWSWRWNFYINVPVGIMAIMMVSAFVHDPPYLRKARTQGGRIDYPGIVMLALGLGLLQIVLDRGQRADWFASAWVIYATVGAALCFAILIRQELVHPQPILDLRIFAKPTFTLATTFVVMMSFTLFSANLLNPVFLQEFMGYSALQAGLVLAPRAIGIMVAMFLAGQLERAGFDTRYLMFGGMALQWAALWRMAHWNLQIGYWQILTPTFMLSTGFSFIFPVLSAATLACVERERMGYAASLYSMVRNVGSAIGISVVSTMLVSGEQIHQSRLAEHFSVFEAWRLPAAPLRMPGARHFLALPDQLVGSKQGLAMIYSQIQLQSAMLALNDIYRMLLTIGISVMPLVLIAWIWQSRKAVRPAHNTTAPAH
ncbi:MAG TPA: DHA2 family efflux MFS transporter permease subunit [Candidatus Binataceae bacterium]